MLAVLTSPACCTKAAAWSGTGVTGKFTLPPAPMTVVEVEVVGTGTVVVGADEDDGLYAACPWT